MDAQDGQDWFDGATVRSRQVSAPAIRTCAKSPLKPFPLTLSLLTEALCNRQMVRQAHHERMKKDFAQALAPIVIPAKAEIQESRTN